MADALRELLAQFVVQVDPDGALKRGELQVDQFKRQLQGLDAVAKGAGKSTQGFFGRMRAAFGASAQGFRAGLSGDGGQGGGFGGLLSGAAALKVGLAGLAGGVIGSQIKGLVDDIGGIGEEAARLGVATDEFQRLKVLAEQNATSVQALGTAFRVVGKAAVDPTNETASAFQRLGVATRSATGEFRSRQDIFFSTAEALADISNENERATLAQQLFGRSAQEILPLLTQGSSGIRAQREELAKLPIVSNAVIGSADKLSDTWPVLMQSLKALAAQILEFAIPAMQGMIDLIIKMAGGIQKLVKPMDLWALGLPALAIGLGLVNTQLRLMIANAGGGTAVLAGMARGFGVLLRSVLPLVAQFLALEDVIVFFMGGKSLTGQMLQGLFGEGFTKHMDELRDAAKDMWGWITGENVQLSGKTSALLAEIGEGLRLMVHDVLAMIPGSGRTAGLEGLRDFEQRRSEGYNSPLNSFFGGVNPNDATGKAAAEYFGRKGDTTVIINNPPPGEAQAIAGQVRNVLDRDRNADLANVQ